MIIYILTATGTVRMLLAENINLITSEKMQSNSGAKNQNVSVYYWCFTAVTS